MRHVVLSHMKTIHLLEEGKRETLCRQSILTGETFEGHPVYKATDTPKAATCQKCRVVLRDSLYAALNREATSVLEVMYDDLHATIVPNKRYKQYHKK